MAEMLAGTLRRAGQRTLQVPCGDLRACTRALRAGEIDLMPAYSGDAVALTRGRPADPIVGLDEARRAFSVLDIMVSRSLGFAAPFRVVMRTDRAADAEIAAIKDLATLEDGVRFAVPEDYAARPGDGLHALSRRHGFGSSISAPGRAGAGGTSRVPRATPGPRTPGPLRRPGARASRRCMRASPRCWRRQRRGRRWSPMPGRSGRRG